MFRSSEMTMMKYIWGGVCAVMLAGTAVGTELIENMSQVGNNAKEESAIMQRVITTLEGEASQATLTLPADAASEMTQGMASWQTVASQVDNKQYGPALKEAIGARRLMRGATRAALTQGPSKEFGALLREYADVMSKRVELLEAQAVNYQLTTTGKENLVVAEALCEEARKWAKKKKWDATYRDIMECAKTLDDVLYETYPSVR